MNEANAPARTVRRLPVDLSRHFPPLFAQRLISASARGDFVAIDRITDEMAAAGLVRPRSDVSKFGRSSQRGN